MEEEQERFLDEGLKNVHAQSFHIHNTIERNNMRQCLRETSQMLSELKTSFLTPKYYYQLYSAIFDQMQYVYSFFKEEARRGRRMKDLYDTVQQASSILPRLYLMITTGAVYIEAQTEVSKEVIYDLLNMIKGLQNPTRGLFTRYFLLKMIKDKFPDKGNDYETPTNTINDSWNFILQNWEEMNRWWIRLSTGTIGNERVLREKERSELRLLVGENIVRLSSLNGLSLDLYQNQILPRMIEILLECKDQLSQQYLMECIIQAFPDEYNIHCMSSILATSTKLNQNVDVKSWYISWMDKLAKFVGDSGKDETEILAAAEKIFDLLKQNIDIWNDQGINQPGGVTDPLQWIELQLAFMKFTVKCCPGKDKLKTINHILSCSYNILTAYNKKLSTDGVRLLGSWLSVPLESEISLFDLQKFPEIMVFLDFTSRTTLAIRIIQSLSNKERLDSAEKVNIWLEFIRPLLEDSADTIEVDMSQFEYEQNIVAKLLFVINTNDPIKLIKMLAAIIPVFSKGGKKRIKYTLPSLVNAFINLAAQVCGGYESKRNIANSNGEHDNTGVHQEFIKYLDLSLIDDDNSFTSYLQQIHSHIAQIINNLTPIYPALAFRLYLSASLQVNSIKVNSNSFAENLSTYLNSALTIYQESEIDQKNKIDLLSNLIGVWLQVTILSQDKIMELVVKIQQLAQTLLKRADQCHATLLCSNWYYSWWGNKQKALECLNKAKRFADFAMTSPENLYLFVAILNKYLYFIEIGKDDDTLIWNEMIEDVIETVRSHIQTIKVESANQLFLPPIEKYFEATLKIINKRKEEGKHKIYGQLQNVNI